VRLADGGRRGPRPGTPCPLDARAPRSALPRVRRADSGHVRTDSGGPAYLRPARPPAPRGPSGLGSWPAACSQRRLPPAAQPCLGGGLPPGPEADSLPSPCGLRAGPHWLADCQWPQAAGATGPGRMHRLAGTGAAVGPRADLRPSPRPGSRKPRPARSAAADGAVPHGTPHSPQSRRRRPPSRMAGRAVPGPAAPDRAPCSAGRRPRRARGGKPRRTASPSCSRGSSGRQPTRAYPRPRTWARKPAGWTLSGLPNRPPLIRFC
jgi:hypothetical protein